MTGDLIALLKEELGKAEKAKVRLMSSLEKAKSLSKEKSNYSDSDLEIFEALSSRFARFSDIIVKKLFKLLEKIDLDDPKTVRESILLAEKKGIIDSYENFFKIRELRNITAHEYEEENLLALISEITTLAPSLFNSLERIRNYSTKY